MNRSLQLVAAALGGGLTAAILVLAVVSGWRQPPLAPITSSAPATAPILAALPHAVLPDNLPSPVDLRAAARQAIPVVVHIKARTEGRQREAVKGHRVYPAELTV